MGTVVIPAFLILLLFAVPFIDRNEKRNPFQRPVAMLCGFLFVTVIVVLTCIGHYSGSGENAAMASTNQIAVASAAAGTFATNEAVSTESTNTSAGAAAAPAPTNQVAAPAASVVNPATPAIAAPASTNAPAPAAPISAATNQIAAPANPVATPATLPITTNAPASAPAAPTPTNQVAVSAISTAASAVLRQNVIPSRTNAVAGNVAASTNQNPTYLRDVLPILAASCSRCHSPQTRIYNWLDYKSTFADRWEIRRRVWDSPKGWYYGEPMPLPGSPEALAITDAQRQTIRNWATDGAVRGVAPLPAPAAPASSNHVVGVNQSNATNSTGDSQAGKALFVSEGCVACHTMEGKGGKVGLICRMKRSWDVRANG